MLSSVWNWILTLVFGAGAAVTAAPIDLSPGDTFITSAKAMTPVNDTVRVGIDIGAVTDEIKQAVVSGKLTPHDIGQVEVEICKSPTDCLQMVGSGTYFSSDSYGIDFIASGPQLKNSRFSAVKVRVDRPLHGVRVSWSNYAQ